MYPFTVLEARSQQGCIPSVGSRVESAPASSSSTDCQLVACGHIIPIPASKDRDISFPPTGGHKSPSASLV